MPLRSSFGLHEVYHVFNRSIAKYEIFNSSRDFNQINNIIKYYQVNRSRSYSSYTRRVNKGLLDENGIEPEKLINIIGYCIMPTHLHLIIQPIVESEKSVSLFMAKILNSYTHYFNISTKRRGPLWESRFKSVHVETDEQLLHLTRYIHLNPVTAYLAEKPEDWKFSSYNEYLNKSSSNLKMCEWEEVLEIEPDSYKDFVEDNISFQRDLAKIKKLLLE